MDESVRKLVDDGRVTVLPDGRIRVTESTWKVLAGDTDHYNLHGDHVEKPKVVEDKGNPRKSGQFDWGE